MVQKALWLPLPPPKRMMMMTMEMEVANQLEMIVAVEYSLMSHSVFVLDSEIDFGQ